MSNVLVLGVGPLPVDQTERLHAPGIRVWHLAQKIRDAGHAVVLGIIEFGDFRDNPEAALRPRQESLGDRLSVFRLRYHSQRTPEALGTLHEHCHFDCIVSTTDIMNYVATRIPVRIPLWFDYLGDPLSERQLQAATFDNDSSLLDLWRVMFSALAVGDRFSVASTPQKYALIGQLANIGRLNQFTSTTDIVSVIPNSSRVMREKPLHPARQLKRLLLPIDAFVLLWSGGYNTWTDPETLFRGLEIAIRQDSMVYFVSVGGEIPGHDNVTYERFRKLCEASDLSSHFVFVGWVTPDEMPHFYAQADAAINIDLPCYEAEIGTRTRIIDWIHYEIPVITTALCEPAKILAEKQLIESFDPQSPQALADAILRLKHNLADAKERARTTRLFLEEWFREERWFSPLLEWVRQPAFAADKKVSHPAFVSSPNGPLWPDSLVSSLHNTFLDKWGKGHPRFIRQEEKKSWWKRITSQLLKQS